MDKQGIAGHHINMSIMSTLGNKDPRFHQRTSIESRRGSTAARLSLGLLEGMQALKHCTECTHALHMRIHMSCWSRFMTCMLRINVS